jgi:hypothetical protein
MKICTGIEQKPRFGNPELINNSEVWYQNVLFGGIVYIRR